MMATRSALIGLGFRKHAARFGHRRIAPAPVHPEPLLRVFAHPALDHSSHRLHGALHVDAPIRVARHLDRKARLQKLDLSRIPNTKHISKDFKGLWWDPTDEYQVPKDFGTTGILYRTDLISKVPESWRDFYDLIKTDGSGKHTILGGGRFPNKADWGTHP